ncbi:hypothetical protein B0H14DRAFT_3126473 [Mycena olivaceomarginata]|nr:hypothetical protein B0H14DRAFT_3126473 [Mycena olivaceomarginata]
MVTRATATLAGVIILVLCVEKPVLEVLDSATLVINACSELRPELQPTHKSAIKKTFRKRRTSASSRPLLLVVHNRISHGKDWEFRVENEMYTKQPGGHDCIPQESKTPAIRNNLFLAAVIQATHLPDPELEPVSKYDAIDVNVAT